MSWGLRATPPTEIRQLRLSECDLWPPTGHRGLGALCQQVVWRTGGETGSLPALNRRPCLVSSGASPSTRGSFLLAHSSLSHSPWLLSGWPGPWSSSHTCPAPSSPPRWSWEAFSECPCGSFQITAWCFSCSGRTTGTYMARCSTLSLFSLLYSWCLCMCACVCMCVSVSMSGGPRLGQPFGTID